MVLGTALPLSNIPSTKMVMWKNIRNQLECKTCEVILFPSFIKHSLSLGTKGYFQEIQLTWSGSHSPLEFWTLRGYKGSENSQFQGRNWIVCRRNREVINLDWMMRKSGFTENVMFD